MCLLLLGSSWAAPLLCQSQPNAVQQGLRVAKAIRVDHAPNIDGTLDDPLWQSAARISDFSQREPYEGRTPTERTEVQILFTKDTVFFCILCRDSEPANIVATQLRRDVSQELDDYFEIVVDSSHSRRNSYVFQINPLGTQRDGLITDEQGLQSGGSDQGDGDPGWDGVWTSVARITSEGWSATIQIPFSTLNFVQSHDVVWGINLKRFIRRKNEQDLWAGWRRSFGMQKISEAGDLHGISEIGSGRLFIVKPYALGGFNHLPPAATSAGLTPGTTTLHTGGADVKIGLRLNLVANLTGNTDFADADVDSQQFNFSQQWDRFRLPISGRDFSVVFGSLQTNYAFSRFLTLSTIFQVNTSNTQAGSANIRLRWNYRPDSDLFLIYTVGQQFASLVAANPAQFTENRFTVKYTYSWQW